MGKVKHTSSASDNQKITCQKSNYIQKNYNKVSVSFRKKLKKILENSDTRPEVLKNMEERNKYPKPLRNNIEKNEENSKLNAYFVNEKQVKNAKDFNENLNHPKLQSSAKESDDNVRNKPKKTQMGRNNKKIDGNKKANKIQENKKQIGKKNTISSKEKYVESANREKMLKKKKKPKQINSKSKQIGQFVKVNCPDSEYSQQLKKSDSKNEKVFLHTPGKFVRLKQIDAHASKNVNSKKMKKNQSAEKNKNVNNSDINDNISESDSEDEEYINKYFSDDSCEYEEGNENIESSDEDTVSDVSGSDESNHILSSDDENGTTFEALIDYYGQYKDKKSSNHRSKNSQDCKLLVEFDESNQEKLQSDSESTDSDAKFDENNSEVDDDISYEEEDPDYLYLTDDEYDLSDEEDESVSLEDIMDSSYDEEDDSDYDPGDQIDDLYIRRGEAQIYDVNDDNISFKNNDNQIFEITESKIPMKDDNSVSDDSCPDLVPIYEEKYQVKNVTIRHKKNHEINVMSASIVKDISNNQMKCPLPLPNNRQKEKIDNRSPLEKLTANTGNNLKTKIITTPYKIDFHSSANIDDEEFIDKVIMREEIRNKKRKLNYSDNDIASIDNSANYDSLETEFSSSDQEEDAGSAFSEIEFPSDNGIVEEEEEDEEDEEEEEEESNDDDESNIEKSTIAKFYNGLNSRSVLLLLSDVIYFHGNLKITLIAGSVDVFGYPLKLNDAQIATASCGYSCLNISPIENNMNLSRNVLKRKLDYFQDNFFASDLAEIQLNFKQNNCLLLLEKAPENSSVNFVKKYMDSNVFPNIYRLRKNRLFYFSEYILKCNFYTSTKLQLLTDLKWKEITVNKNSKIIITGGKNVGKSTLARYLINSSISNHECLLLIDLDIGQSEIFIPQTISATIITKPILGTGCFNQLEPFKAYLYGDLNIVISPIKYYKCVINLLKDIKSKSEYAKMPWIINTMGYAKGFGLELMAAIISTVNPTDVIQFEHEIGLENFPSVITNTLVDDFNYNIFAEEIKSMEFTQTNFRNFLLKSSIDFSIEKEVWKMKANEGRLMNILAHLGPILKDNCHWISEVIPYHASLSQLKIFVTNDDENIDNNSLPNLINANLVYLCKIPSDCEHIFKDNPIECFGIGIVRGIDIELDKVYLLTSVPVQKLSNCNALSICNIPLPASILINQSSKVKGTIPYVYNTDKFIGSRKIVDRPFRSAKAMNAPHQTF